ncbi:MAG: HipA domain-containing protein [Clostridia bacterium]|nr:HipA domain-containing protein [Deltaproteobacteria bacterium]
MQFCLGDFTSKRSSSVSRYREDLNATATRIADLLIAEHHAGETLRAFGDTSAYSEIIESEGQIFLEVERFDRLPNGGRRGVVSLAAFDNEFVAHHADWSATARRMTELKLVTSDVERRIRFRDTFGAFIANSDRHTRNLSFFADGTQILDLAPNYDMSPWFFAPVSNTVTERTFTTPRISPANADVAEHAFAAAMAYWKELESDSRLSQDFRAIASKSLVALEQTHSLLDLLPRP